MSFLNRKIFSKEGDFFGIDLGDSSVKIFQLKRDINRDTIRSFASVILPKGSIEDGKIIDKARVVAAIREAIRVAKPKKISTKKVVCSLPESKAFIRIVSIPKIEEEEAAEAVKWEIEASIPLSIDQVYYDWQFIDQSENKQNVLTVAVSRDVVDDTVEVLEQSGLLVYGLEVGSVANIRSLVPNNAKNSGSYLVVDIGERKTEFIIAEGCVPYFTSSIPFSSDGVTDVIAKNMGISFSEAEKIKINQGIEYSVKNNVIFLSVKSILENLIIEIEKTIDFYQGVSKKPVKVESIIITGGGANLKGLIPYLTTRLARPVFIGNPWINLRLGSELPAIGKVDSIGYSTAIGLALKKIDYGNKH